MSKPSLCLRKEQVELFRRAAGMKTNAELARAAKVNSTTIDRVMAGKTSVGVDVLVGLLYNAFPQLSFDDLFEITEDTGAEAAA
ncbi:hypothetical protein [Pseudonocardia sp.]|uniref:hypothetical protein n=1 Tax=Pseudonocardia sp. TaxID=60912 RepID=UPI003D0A6176